LPYSDPTNCYTRPTEGVYVDSIQDKPTDSGKS